MNNDRPAPNPADLLPPRDEAEIAVANLSNLLPADMMDYVLIAITRQGQVVITGTPSHGRTAAILRSSLQVILEKIVNGDGS